MLTKIIPWIIYGIKALYYLYPRLGESSFLFGKYAMNGMTEIEENMWELFFAPDLSCKS